MVKIRQAAHADIPAIIEMGRALHAESPRFRGDSFSDVKIANRLRQLLGTAVTRGEGGALIAEDGDRLVGLMAGYVAEEFFGYDRIATDYSLYVVPEYRGGTVGVRLIKAFEEWAWKAGATAIQPGISTEIDADRTRGIYERLGYGMFGYLMIKRRG